MLSSYSIACELMVNAWFFVYLSGLSENLTDEVKDHNTLNSSENKGILQLNNDKFRILMAKFVQKCPTKIIRVIS